MLAGQAQFTQVTANELAEFVWYLTKPRSQIDKHPGDILLTWTLYVKAALESALFLHPYY